MIISSKNTRQKSWVVFRRPSPDGNGWKILHFQRSQLMPSHGPQRYTIARNRDPVRFRVLLHRAMGSETTRWHHSDCLGIFKDFSHATNSIFTCSNANNLQVLTMAYNILQWLTIFCLLSGRQISGLQWIESSTGRGHVGGFCIRPGRIQRGETISECVTRKSMKMVFESGPVFLSLFSETSCHRCGLPCLPNKFRNSCPI